MWMLVAESGEHCGACWPIESVPKMIGRGAGCAIILDDSGVSRNHCTVAMNGRGAIFEDLGSRNATLLNGLPCPKGPLNRGDKLTIGDTVFVVCSSDTVTSNGSLRSGESTIHVLPESSVSYLGSEAVDDAEGNPQTVSDLYWLFSASRKLSEPQVREQFVATLIELLSERFEQDGVLIRGLPYVQTTTQMIHSYGDLLSGNGTSPEGILDSDLEEASGKIFSTAVDGQRLCTLLATITIGSENVGVLMLQRLADTNAYGHQDLEALVALCKAVGPLYQSVCAMERMIRQQDRKRSDAPSSAMLLGNSTGIQDVRASMDAANRSHMPILIEGETGTGKEVVARAFHAQSHRSEQPFVSVNCAIIQGDHFDAEIFGYAAGAMPGTDAARAGYFSEADNGVLFLDEISALSMENQAKLLGVLENQTFVPVGGGSACSVDVRVIVASNVSLHAAIERERFREDLYHRLCGIQIEVPPLRNRRSDISSLAAHFIAESCNEMGESPKSLSAEATAKLEEWDWPGNVRELRMCIDRALAYSQSTVIDVKDIILHDPRHQRSETSKSLAEMERYHIVQLLDLNGGNISASAKALGISRTTLYHKLNEYGMRD